MKGWFKSDTKQFFPTAADLNAWQSAKAQDARGVSACSVAEQGALISQGAEGKVYFSRFLGKETVTKERVRKSYRVPLLDAKLNKARLLQEARCMVRCQQLGVDVPRVLMVDTVEYKIHMEKIEGLTLKALLHRDMAAAAAEREALQRQSGVSDDASSNQPPQRQKIAAGTAKELNLNSNTNSSDNVYSAHHLHLAACVGRALARLHASHVVHGDLTTSNFMVRESRPEEIVVIDFGLGSMQAVPEDKAVDLYVLERAFLATHPGSGPLVERVMAAYTSMYDSVAAEATAAVTEEEEEEEQADGGGGGGAPASGSADSAPNPKKAKKNGPDSDKNKAGGKAAAAAADPNSNSSRHENCLAVLRRLEDVRMRGRKRDMFG